MSNIGIEKSSDVANAKINEIKENAKDKFSEKEIDDFIQLGRILSSKSVLSGLIEVLKEGPSRGFSTPESDRLVKRITALMPCAYSGFTNIEITGMDIRLNLSLTICEKDYVTAVDGPDDPEFIKDLYAQYNFLKNTASAYWKQFCQEQPDIYNRICQYRTDIDFSELVVDTDSPTTMYFDPLCTKRIGILAYYVDKNGKPYMKRTKK